MSDLKKRNPRILLITPEITYLPEGMGNLANYLTAKAGGLADVSAGLVTSLYEAGMDVHVALPNYRTMFNRNVVKVINRAISAYRRVLPGERIHLAEDRCFYYRDSVYDSYAAQNMKLALSFQREVANNIIPRVQPDIIHCNDWMTGLLPAVAKQLGIASLFTVHNIHSMRATLEQVEDSGIDAGQFWPFLFYERIPQNYEETRSSNKVDFLTSGIFAASVVNTVSSRFLTEIISEQHNFVAPSIVYELRQKVKSGMAVGVLNSPDPSFDPQTDDALNIHFNPENHLEAKSKNKRVLQRTLGLIEDPSAPLFFWPSRLDPVQKGCRLLAEVLHEMLSRYAQERLQIVFVANGPYQKEFQDLVGHSNLHQRVSVRHFDEPLSRLGYAASDFILMPSSFEPCGLPQMIGPLYGSLPIAHDTGGIHDSVSNLSIQNNSGNGFLFEVHDAAGLRWAMNQAMDFFKLPLAARDKQISRIMKEAKAQFNQKVTARKYMSIYQLILNT